VALVDCEGVGIKLGKVRPYTNREAARKLAAVDRARWRYVVSRAASLTSSSLTGSVRLGTCRPITGRCVAAPGLMSPTIEGFVRRG
jgi:hypothetical protein